PGIFTGVNINFNFQLKTFTRQDNFTAEITPDNPGPIEVILEYVNLFKCGSQPEDSFSIVYQSNVENTPPVASDDDFYETDQDVTLVISAPGVLANDFDQEGETLTAEIRDLPENGTVTLNSDGSFTYEPDEGFYGTDTFTYVASDGEGISNEA